MMGRVMSGETRVSGGFASPTDLIARSAPPVWWALAVIGLVTARPRF